MSVRGASPSVVDVLSVIVQEGAISGKEICPLRDIFQLTT